MGPVSEHHTLTEFRGKYLATDGIESVELGGEYEGTNSLVAHVRDADAFDATSLPAEFRGFTVLIDDGTHVHEARGPLV
jgi:hypothetical protein